MGLARPLGYRAPPRPTATDVARTVGAVVSDVVPHLARLGWHRVGSLPTTCSSEGLAAVRGAFGPTLRRLGVELEVRLVENVPREGGLVLMWNQESHLDHLVLASAIPRPFFSLYNNE